MPYDPDGFWIPEPERSQPNNPSAYVGGTDAPVNYTYDSIVPSGVDLGSLGGIQSTSGGYDWAKLGQSLLDKATTPAGVASLMTLFAGLSGANKPSAAPGWKGVIDPNAMVANREQIAQPAYVPYSGQPVMGQKHFTDVQYSPRTAAASGPVGGDGVPLRKQSGVPVSDEVGILDNRDGMQQVALWG